MANALVSSLIYKLAALPPLFKSPASIYRSQSMFFNHGGEFSKILGSQKRREMMASICSYWIQRRPSCWPLWMLTGLQLTGLISRRVQCIPSPVLIFNVPWNQNFWLSYSSLLIRFSDAASLDEITKPASPIPEECFRLCNNTRCLVLPTHTQFPSIYTLFQQGD